MSTSKLLPAALVAAPALAYEEPAYEVLHQTDDYEVRRYEPYLVAETTVSGGFDRTGNTAFRRLAGYIFGDNRRQGTEGESVSMNMTVPVTRHRSDGDGTRTVYRFVMERAYDLESLPVPNATEVKLKRVAGGPVAVLRYAGRITESRFARYRDRLYDALDRDGIEPLGAPMSAVYNGPFTLPPFRRNEVMIPLASYPETSTLVARE